MKAIFFSFLLSAVIILSCNSNTLTEPGDKNFGYGYSIADTSTFLYIQNDTLYVSVAYSGCNGGHSFELRYKNLNRTQAELWLYKTTPDQMCTAYFGENLMFALPYELKDQRIIFFAGPKGCYKQIR